MRKLTASIVGAAALLVVPLSLTTTPAFADPNNGQPCSQNGDVRISNGACANPIGGNGSRNAFWEFVCNEIQRQDPAAFNAAFKNLGDCVSTFNQQPLPTLVPSPTPPGSPGPTESPEPTESAEPTESPEPSESPEPTDQGQQGQQGQQGR